MNTANAQLRENSPPPPGLEEMRWETGPEESGSLLARVTRDARFSRVAPRLLAVLEQRDQPGSTILEALTDNIRRLQDAFVEALYTLFHAHGIDTGHKMTLRLDNAVLSVAGEHPDGNRIADALAASPDLSAAFAELASQSAALRDLTNLHVMTRNGIHADLPAKPLPLPGQPAYLLSLKGDMNHFYFCPRG